MPGVDESEFAVGRRDAVEFHQVKRQRADGPWTIAALAEVLRGFRRRLAESGTRCTFVSTEPAKQLHELCDRAARAESVEEFELEVATNKAIEKAAEQLVDIFEVKGLPEVWALLQRIQVEYVSEAQLIRLLRSESRQLVAATPEQVMGFLGDLLEDSVSKTLGAPDVWQHISSQGWRRAELGRDPDTLAAIEKQNRRFRRYLDDLLIGDRFYTPDEAATVLEVLRDPKGPKAVLVSGDGGAGKSGVIREVFDRLSDEGWSLLALRADWLPASPTSAQLVADLGIPASPAIVLAALQSGGQKLLILDQLDSVSAVSGRRTGLLVALKELFDELADMEGVRVLIACRQFDLETDRRLRRLANDPRLETEPVLVAPWDETSVGMRLQSLGLAKPEQPRLLKLLEIPLHLALYVEVASQSPEVAAQVVTAADLFSSYWDFKRQQVEEAFGRPLRWLEVLEAVSDGIERERALWVPKDLVDRHEGDARAMTSAGVLREDEGQISFFHEAFFDYVFGRLFAHRDGKLVDYLLTRDQELFRRSQVRQVLNYQRLTRPARFRSELFELLGSPQIRFHLKVVAVDLLDKISEPNAHEWGVLHRLLRSGPPQVRRRLLSLVRGNAEWFALAVDAGFIAKWLESEDPEQQNQITEILASQQHRRPDIVARLLRHHAGRDEQWVGRLRFVVQNADLALDREFFELVLDLIDEGVLDGLTRGIAVNSDFWDLGYGLSEKKPCWAAELCIHHFIRQTKRARAYGELNPFSAELELLPDSQLGPKIMLSAAEGAPEVLAAGLVPVILVLSRENAAEDGYHDDIWRYRSQGMFRMADAVRGAAERALRNWAAAPSPAIEGLLAEIRAVDSATADYLLLAAYAGAVPRLAEEAVDALLADGARRLDLRPTAALVIANVGPHISELRFRELEEVVLAYRSACERANPTPGRWGESQFQLLRAFPRDRLSEVGGRRLGEFERKFQLVQMEDSSGVYGGFMQSPVPAEAVPHMDDEDWLRAMRKHRGSRSFDVEHPLKGGAGELAQLFRGQFKDYPDRFVRLAAQLPAGVNTSYHEAALWGTREVIDRVQADLVWDVCRRYRDTPDRELQKNLLRLIEGAAASGVPDDVLEVAAHIAIDAKDPDHEVWQKDDYSGKPLYGGDIDTAAINCTRGAGALALGAVLRSTPTLSTRLADVLDRLVSDPVFAVRAAAAHVVLALVGTDDERAVELFERLVEGAPDELLGSHAVFSCLDHLLRRRPDIILPLVARMLQSPLDAVSWLGGQLTAVAWLLGLEPIETWLGAGAAARAGAIAVMARQVRYPESQERCAPHLRSAFSDPAGNVREAARQAFWDLEPEELERLEDICMDFLASRSRADHLGHLVDRLDNSRAVLPRVVDAVAGAFLEEAGYKLSDIRFAEAAQAATVASLVVRTYGATSDRTEQGRCLDVLDQLLERGAYGVEKPLADFER
ncbi:MAG: ATP-binding protein [Candidatus Dormibacteraeota bacterium]|nr:ATP-binding protein [Candidatus Dormibacteraeota bacterium]